MTAISKATVLFVDDEAAVLDGFKLNLGSRYDVRVAASGGEGLDIAEQTPNIAVVVSDMRMPEMDGAEFLARIKNVQPDAMRILLTGFADSEAAARAVNEGRIFRYLTKPCNQENLSDILAAAVDQHRLLTAERTLLHKTLVGSMKAVVAVLGLADPIAMGKAVRVRDRSREVATALSTRASWDVEFAALFSQLAATTLPEEVASKVEEGRELSAEDRDQIARSTEGIIELLKEIPRLEPVIRILEELMALTLEHMPREETADRPAADARMLRAIIDLEAFESRGLSPRQALEKMSEDATFYGSETVAALEDAVRKSEELDIAECPVSALQDGMVLAEDLLTSDGLLLLPRGFQLTRSSRQHMINRFEGRLANRVRVRVDFADPASKNT